MNETKRTLREKKFIEAYIENNGNATEAYLTLNPKVKRKNASVYGVRMLEKVSIGVKEFLDKLGLDNLSLSQKLKEGLEAVKKVSGAEVPDHNVRVRYLDMAFKLKNTYPAAEHNVKLDPESELTLKSGNATEKLIEELDRLVEKHDIEIENWTEKQWSDHIKEVRARKEEREREESKNDDDTQKGGGKLNIAKKGRLLSIP